MRRRNKQKLSFGRKLRRRRFFVCQRERAAAHNVLKSRIVYLVGTDFGIRVHANHQHIAKRTCLTTEVRVTPVHLDDASKRSAQQCDAWVSGERASAANKAPIVTKSQLRGTYHVKASVNKDAHCNNVVVRQEQKKKAQAKRRCNNQQQQQKRHH